MIKEFLIHIFCNIRKTETAVVPIQTIKLSAVGRVSLMQICIFEQGSQSPLPRRYPEGIQRL
jgi:hypothetical protein